MEGQDLLAERAWDKASFDAPTAWGSLERDKLPAREARLIS